MSESGTERVGKDVGRFLEHAYGSSETDDDGDFVVRPRGALTWVRVRSVGDDRTAVIVFSPAAIEVRVDGELTRFLATEDLNLDFAHFELHDRRRPMVVVSHSLLGEFTSREELTTAVEEVSATAEHYGPLLSDRFGGWAPSGARPRGVTTGRGAGGVLDALRSSEATRLMGRRSGPSPRLQAGLTLLGLVVGLAAAATARDITGSWWLAVFVFAMVFYLLGPAALEVVTRPQKLRRGVLLSLLPVTATVVLVLSYWLLGRWWPAVLLGLALGLVGGVALGAWLFPDLVQEPSSRDKARGLEPVRAPRG